MIRRENFPELILGSLLEFSAEHELIGVKADPLQFHIYPNFFSVNVIDFPMSTMVTVVKRESAILVGGLSEERVTGIDQEFIWKLGDRGLFVRITSPHMVAYRKHENNLSKNLGMCVAGIKLFLQRERHDLYPGGAVWKLSRRRILCAQARTISVNSIHCGRISDAIELYLKTFWWNHRFLRFRYLAGLPIMVGYAIVLRIFSNMTKAITLSLGSRPK